MILFLVSSVLASSPLVIDRSKLYNKTLPLPSYAEVTNLDNGRKVVVKINDRGPFHDDRLIDLSYSAAAKLGIVDKGTGKVEVRAINPQGNTAAAPADTTARAVPVSRVVMNSAVAQQGTLFLQVGAFSSLARAEQIRQQIEQQIEDRVHISEVEKEKNPLYRVRVGPLKSAEYGDQIASRLLGFGFSDTRLVNE